MKGFFSLSLLTGLLFGAYIDTDIDGVEDSLDLCKNTPFDQLVDAFGCSENASENIWTLKAGTELGFDTFDEKDLENYLASGEWQGKAGGCMVEGFCKPYIREVKGYESCAMGLSVEVLKTFIG